MLCNFFDPPPAIHGYQLSPKEHALSVTSCPLGTIDPQRVYYVVGTAFVNQTEKEPSQGRVLVLEVTEGQLCVCVCVCVRACVRVCMCDMCVCLHEVIKGQQCTSQSLQFGNQSSGQ